MKPKLLVTYSMASTHVQTTRDYLWAFKQYSSYDVSYMHVTHAAQPGVDLDAFDVIVHSYCARLAFDNYVSEAYKDALRRTSALKVLAVQDEYNSTNKIKAAIKDLGFDIVLTCVPEDGLDYVYAPKSMPGVAFECVLTGYVAEVAGKPERPVKPLSERTIPVGYRGRDIGAIYGRLGYEKFEVGNRVRQACEARGLRHDIAMDEASRIYGPAWLDFVGNCRAMLGSESGSNVFDFDGSIRAKYLELGTARGGRLSYEEFAPHLGDVEGRIEMGQISPRVFECALLRTPMVLIKGRYSGAIEANEHYIPIERDFSNLDEVLDRIQDLPALEAMADRTFRHLVASGDFGYRTFIARLDRCFSGHIAQRPAVTSAPRPPAGVALGTEDQVLKEFPTEWPRMPEEAAARKRELDRDGLGTVGGSLYAALLKHSPISVKVKIARVIKEALDGGDTEPRPVSRRAVRKLLQKCPPSVVERIKANVSNVEFVALPDQPNRSSKKR